MNFIKKKKKQWNFDSYDYNQPFTNEANFSFKWLMWSWYAI